jgi:SAM-dependent methyltransferase
LLGNSFGHCSDEGDLEALREVYRVLKLGGIFIIDHVDGSWIRSNLSQSGWEWLEGKKTLLACRERELSPDKTLLASREIVIDLEGPTIL